MPAHLIRPFPRKAASWTIGPYHLGAAGNPTIILEHLAEIQTQNW